MSCPTITLSLDSISDTLQAQPNLHNNKTLWKSSQSLLSYSSSTSSWELLITTSCSSLPSIYTFHTTSSTPPLDQLWSDKYTPSLTTKITLSCSNLTYQTIQDSSMSSKSTNNHFLSYLFSRHNYVGLYYFLSGIVMCLLCFTFALCWYICCHLKKSYIHHSMKNTMIEHSMLDTQNSNKNPSQSHLSLYQNDKDIKSKQNNKYKKLNNQDDDEESKMLQEIWRNEKMKKEKEDSDHEIEEKMNKTASQREIDIVLTDEGDKKTGYQRHKSLPIALNTQKIKLNNKQKRRYTTKIQTHFNELKKILEYNENDNNFFKYNMNYDDNTVIESKLKYDFKKQKYKGQLKTFFGDVMIHLYKLFNYMNKAEKISVTTIHVKCLDLNGNQWCNLNLHRNNSISNLQSPMSRSDSNMSELTEMEIGSKMNNQARSSLSNLSYLTRQTSQNDGINQLVKHKLCDLEEAMNETVELEKKLQNAEENNKELKKQMDQLKKDFEKQNEEKTRRMSEKLINYLQDPLDKKRLSHKFTNILHSTSSSSSSLSTDITTGSMDSDVSDGLTNYMNKLIKEHSTKQILPSQQIIQNEKEEEKKEEEEEEEVKKGQELNLGIMGHMFDNDDPNEREVRYDIFERRKSMEEEKLGNLTNEDEENDGDLCIRIEEEEVEEEKYEIIKEEIEKPKEFKISVTDMDDVLMKRKVNDNGIKNIDDVVTRKMNENVGETNEVAKELGVESMVNKDIFTIDESPIDEPQFDETKTIHSYSKSRQLSDFDWNQVFSPNKKNV